MNKEVFDGLTAERTRLINLPEHSREQTSALNNVLRSFEGTDSPLYKAARDEAEKCKTEKSGKRVKAIDALLDLYDAPAVAVDPDQTHGGVMGGVISILQERSPMSRSAICSELKDRGYYFTDSNVIRLLRDRQIFAQVGSGVQTCYELHKEQPSNTQEEEHAQV